MVNQARMDRRLDGVFAGLADPTRRAILARLATGEKTISDLASRFDMSLPAVSKHIRVLERAGLARVRREGRSRRTALVAAPLREAVDWIADYRRFWEFQLDQLAAYLGDPEAPAASPPSDGAEAWPPQRTSRAKASKSGARSRRPRSASSRPGRGRRS
jgi:DNA-binding transcriptional ArsR family regulator